MSACPSCQTQNPPGSKFCAGCGAALPALPVPLRCASCGAESPEGSRFCKGCGKPVGAGGAGGAGRGRTAAPPVAPKPKALGEGAQRIRTLLLAGAGLYGVALFLMYSELARMKAAFGPYAGQLPGADTQWFLIILDACLAAGNIYASTLAGKGDFKYAKWLFAAMAVLGLIFFVRGLKGSIVFILINGAVMAAGAYGYRLVGQEERKAAAA